MTRIRKWLFVLTALAITTIYCHASPTFLCTETIFGETAGNGANGLQNGGCVNSIPNSSPTLYVASDGEASIFDQSFFQPFGVGFDTSDAISLNSNWLPNLAFPGMSTPGFWTQCLTCVDVNGVLNPFTWVLPAATSCGNEFAAEVACEPFGAWFAPGAKWAPGTPNVLVILEDSGTGSWSDKILVNNFGPGGSAQIIFSSDPNLIPEPGTFTLIGTGLAFAAARLRRKSA